MLLSAALGILAGCATGNWIGYDDGCWSWSAGSIEFDCENWTAEVSGLRIERKHSNCDKPCYFRYHVGLDWDRGGGPDGNIDYKLGNWVDNPHPTLPITIGNVTYDGHAAKGRRGQFVVIAELWTRCDDKGNPVGKPLFQRIVRQNFGG